MNFLLRHLPVDLMMRAAMHQPTPEHSMLEPSTPQEDTTSLGDEERTLGHTVPFTVQPHGSESSSPDKETELQMHPGSTTSAGRYIKHKTSHLLDTVRNKTQRGDRNKPIPSPNVYEDSVLCYLSQL
jgi:hypothetical protein